MPASSADKPNEGSTAAKATAFAADITGAGATFPYPIYAKWADAYKKATGTGMNYQSIGSGGGIKQITAKTVNFGASDMPMKAEDLEKNGLMQFPAIMGGVVPVYNLKGIGAGEIKFTGELLANIYLGKIKNWSQLGGSNQTIVVVSRDTSSACDRNDSASNDSAPEIRKTSIGGPSPRGDASSACASCNSSRPTSPRCCGACARSRWSSAATSAPGSGSSTRPRPGWRPP